MKNSFRIELKEYQIPNYYIIQWHNNFFNQNFPHYGKGSSIFIVNLNPFESIPEK
jgi:hypothetical protein